MPYIFDACALISFLYEEEGCNIVQDLLKKAEDGDADIYMNIVNLIEVNYGNIRSLGSEKAAVILEGIFASPIQIVSEVSDEIFSEASRLKASYKCSLADAIGLATAIEFSGQFVTSDHHELEAVAKNESISFLWLPPHSKSN